ncbi:MAG: hypothetical protein AAGC60_01680 [Acidobacteriota bacterium]
MSLQGVQGVTAVAPPTVAPSTAGTGSGGVAGPVGAGPSFDEVLERFTAERTGAGRDVAASTQAPAAIEEPSAVGRIVRGADAMHHRLVDLTERLSVDEMSARELFQVQLEAQRLTIGLETTTKAISESSNNLKQTLQQQI